MVKHIACLTFDFDLWSGFVARGMSTPTPVSRGEFGLIGAKRILTLLARYSIKSTWYVPGVVIDTYESAVEEIVAAGHEIAHHGYSHVAPDALAPEKEEAEMLRAIESIRRASGVAPRGYRSPSWDLSENTLPMLLHNGFIYDSSLMGGDHLPYFPRTGDKPHVDKPFEFGTATSLLEMPISWSLDDHPHFEFFKTPSTVTQGLANATNVLENWTADFRYMIDTTDFGILTYTCHPYVIGRGHRMLMLENLIKSLLDMSAEFLTMEEAARTFLSLNKE